MLQAVCHYKLKNVII